jgi:cell wall-associated NlpC family hydrolase
VGVAGIGGSGISARAAVVNAAVEMVGVPYRYGGSSPAGFDCSGLVVYSYEKAGFAGLPHSAARLADLSRPVALDDLEPGDLMFFELTGKKASHVGIYVGNQKFVHAPSSGGRVEIVGFDHVYWRDHIGKAGRLMTPPERVAQAH